MKKIAVLQSNYIPWKGYFDIIASVDEFIIYDDVQYTKNDWRNRNRIKTSSGLQWLTIPVFYQFAYERTQKIRDTRIKSIGWQMSHWEALVNSYKLAPHFNEIAVWLRPLYENMLDENLSHVNLQFIKAICCYIGIKTKLSYSWDYLYKEGRTERLISLCKQTGADEYISGPKAKNYIEESMFDNAGISLRWFDYSNYPVYPQMWGKFTHEVSILDLLFNCGKDASNYMKYKLE